MSKRTTPTATTGHDRSTRSAVDPERLDDLRPSRGIMTGVILGIALWLAIAAVVWVLILVLP